MKLNHILIRESIRQNSIRLVFDANYLVSNTQPPIIKCKNSRMNHYPRQTYNKFKSIPLASENWRGHKSVGDSFTIHIYDMVRQVPEFS